MGQSWTESETATSTIVDFICFHARPAESCVASSAVHLRTALILLYTGSTVRAWSLISSEQIELISGTMLFSTSAFMPVKVTQEAGIMSTVCTGYTIRLALFSNLPITPELWTPDEIRVIVNHSTQPESRESFVLLFIQKLCYGFIWKL